MISFVLNFDKILLLVYDSKYNYQITREMITVNFD
jgi:hypothetical protein